MPEAERHRVGGDGAAIREAEGPAAIAANVDAIGGNRVDRNAARRALDRGGQDLLDIGAVEPARDEGQRVGRLAGPPLEPVAKVVRMLRERAHVLDPDVEKMMGIDGPIGEAAAAAARAIDQRNVETPDRLARQVNGEQRAAEAGPDDGDRGRAHVALPVKARRDFDRIRYDAARKLARPLHRVRRWSAASSVSRFLAKQKRIWLLTSRPS